MTAMGASSPSTVVDLVERFVRDRKVFPSPDYKEEQLHVESIGWSANDWGRSNVPYTQRSGVSNVMQQRTCG